MRIFQRLKPIADALGDVLVFAKVASRDIGRRSDDLRS
jgi:hypothetical protein